MAKTYRKSGDHGEKRGRDGDGAFKHWSRHDCEDYRAQWDDRYSRSKKREIIAEQSE